MKRFFPLFVIFIAACGEEIVIPDPVPLTREANGFYCNMIVIDHPGPKAQLFEKGQQEAIWFTSVRDALAYKILPGEAQQLQAIYVHDMGQAKSWDKPQADGIWIRASKAYYVIESSKRGGMGAREAVPFRDREKADNFRRDFGGRLVRLSDIPSDYILGDAGDHAAGQ